MSGPTREELDKLVATASFRTKVTEGDEKVRYQRIADLLLAFPLPPEDGEREGSARFLDERVASELSGMRNLSAHYDDPEERQLIADANRAHREVAERYRCAAALLRQPPPPPAAGVGKAEVLAVVNRLARRHPNWQELYDDIEALPEAAPPPYESVGSVIQAIAAERRRQVETEGWTREHDASHVHGELAQAACCYAMPAKGFAAGWWPWDMAGFKRKDRRRDLIRAAALLVAEIERLDGPGREEPTAAPPSRVDREADGWRYLPELPPEDDGTAQYLAAGTDEGVPTVWLAPFTAAEIRAARAGFYAWRPAPEPPPLPEAKPLTPGPPTSTLPT